MTGDARGYSRKPFGPGNEVAVKHGAYSLKAVAPLAQAILTEVTAGAPSWLESVDASALTAWAEAEARCDVLRVWTNEHGLLDEKGRATGAADLLLRCERTAMALRGRLGFDPLSRAALGRDTAIARSAATSAVERASAVGRELREAREREVSNGSD